MMSVSVIAVLATTTAVQDTVAFVTKPGGPVDTSRYMWAGYIVTAVVYVGYAVLLKRRIARTRGGS